MFIFRIHLIHYRCDQNTMRASPPNHWHPHLRKECRQKCTRVNALNGLDIVALTHTPAQCAQRQGEGACAHAWPRWRWLSSSYDKVQAYCIRHIDTMVCPSIGPSVGWMVTCFFLCQKRITFFIKTMGAVQRWRCWMWLICPWRHQWHAGPCCSLLARKD